MLFHTLALVPLLLALAACTSEEPTAPAITPTEAQLSLHGSVTAWDGDATITGRRLALCQLDSPEARYPIICTLTNHTATTGIDGQFQFVDIKAARYAILHDSGLADFDTAMARWQGQVLQPGNWEWMQDTYLQGNHPNLHIPDDLPDGVDRASYAIDTLLLGQSPFVLAHTIVGANAFPIIVDVRQGPPDQLTFSIISPQSPDYAALRETIGPLSREEAAGVDREAVARWEAFMAGDDGAFVDTDAQIVSGLHEGTLFPIGNTILRSLEEEDGRLVKAVVYTTIDVQSGEEMIVARVDRQSGRVIESRSGYRLNVLDPPGRWIETGPNGEQFLHYGFSYYRRWGQILPDPLITMIDAFYQDGAAHVSRNIGLYQDGANDIGGDLDLVMWDGTLANEIALYRPSQAAAPYLRLPDSGSVDVRRERFAEAISSGQVVVDEDSVWEYLRSPETQISYQPDATFQDVVDGLLTPYRSGHLFNDVEAAIILDATYGGDGPLTIRISPRLREGYSVPRRGSNEINISRRDVAIVILGYAGALNARWPHEMAHILDFRDPAYQSLRRDGGMSRCEPLKYMMEFMWWVRSYPNDAPDETWMPVESGLTLARLLTNTYPNSGC